MKKLFAWIAVLLGIWLMITPWLLDYREMLPQWHDTIVGLVIIILGLIFNYSKVDHSLNWLHFVNIILGLWLCASGIFIFGPISTIIRLNEIIVGILLTLFSVIATQIIEGKKTYVYTKEGSVLVEMSKMNYKDGIIVMKGKAFGSMPQVMHVRPNEIWNMVGMVPFEIILHMPKLLYLGWKQSKEKVAAKNS
ncbi:MAG: SPW repeat protein [Syntrophomonadaceae bacterium]|nr:SPW repeat protein [Syntrophomonadaceae bacterium]